MRDFLRIFSTETEDVYENYEPMSVPVWMEDAFNIYAQNEAMTLFSGRELESQSTFIMAFNKTVSKYIQDAIGTDIPHQDDLYRRGGLGYLIRTSIYWCACGLGCLLYT